MSRYFRRIMAVLLAATPLCTAFSGCKSKPVTDAPTTTVPGTTSTEAANTVPTDYVWAAYNAAEDAAFQPKNIFSPDMYIPGLDAGEQGSGMVLVTDRTDTGAYVLKGEYGKCYEVKIPAGTPRALAVTLRKDPAAEEVGETIWYSADNAKCDEGELTEELSFMYVCREEGYLLICTGSENPVYIGERTILAEKDTEGNWYIPEPVGSIGWDCTYANFVWPSEEIINNLYEPVRQRYPEYITRTVIGKDQSGKYDMYGYIYEPENYETTMFLTGGMHGSEGTGYFALSKVMQLIADAKPEDQLLYTLRHKVRFVVIPIINVYGASNGRTRANSTGMDLNRDFAELTQQESKNVIAFFEEYAKDAKIAMDFHIATSENVSVYFNFINYTDNAVANYKTTNHMYHRYLEEGCAKNPTDMKKIPGSYVKNSKYLEGRIWNSYAVPTITVEFVTNDMFPTIYTSESMTLAVETYMNFIIQNALFFLQ